MARKRKKRNRDYLEELPELHLSHATRRMISIIAFLLIAIITVLSLFDAAGSLGEIISRISDLLFGWGALIVPLIFLAVAFGLLLASKKEKAEEQPVSSLRVYIGAIVFTFSVTGLLHAVAMRGSPDQAFELVKQGLGGGYFGVLSSFPLMALLDFWATFTVFLAAIIVSLILLFPINFRDFYSRASEAKRSMENQKNDSARTVKINKMETTGFAAAEVIEKGEAEDEEGGDKEPVISSFSPQENGQGEIDYKLHQDRYRKGNWQLPALDLLENSHDTVDSGNIEVNVKIIQKTLGDFGIPVEMSEVNVGPTVTQYTLRPAQGIKLSQIISLQNDLALALAASSIRIEAPIPGRSLVGIEVPNKASAVVRLKDVIATDQFVEHKSNLAIALGRDVAGHGIVADLARMPHLLIAGATGTGKSVGINSMLISFLYRNSPEELRLIVIDPKRVELSLYNGIPHLLTPVVTDHKKAVNALKWAVNEMDRRYELLAGAGKRNIGEYNSGKPADRLPYIVIVVDELADLMAVAQADVEAAVVRLAQMARAVGVHLVLATQRPSVDIITGLIKANITARMAYAVASQVDSRTILDSSGADKLLGAGDMLFITAEFNKPKRIQGTYISEKEVRNVVNFVKDQSGEVDYTEEILEKQQPPSSVSGISDGEDDDMLQEAIDEVRRAGKASASLLQRRLRIGYARAARLLDLMEEQGIIGPGDGAKPRDVYMDTPDN